MGLVTVRLLAAVLVALALGGAAHAAPKRYYLALGDSLAYGIQPQKAEAGLPPSAFRTGYVDVFAARLRAIAPGIKTVNYGCPGESTKTFVAGGCPWLVRGQRLHDAFRGSQLAAALAFLRAHPGQVSPITLTLWANDITAYARTCNGDLACVRAGAPRALEQFGVRLGSIVGRLRAAAPQADIVLTGAWNDDLETFSQTDPLYRALDTVMARVATAAKARFARVMPAFDPPGTAARKARLCALTYICSRGDSHPTDAGYRAIAAAVLAASGYAHHP
jgi:lysophospholipase L1-like esterase